MKTISSDELQQLCGGTKTCDFIHGVTYGAGIYALFGAALNPWVGAGLLVGNFGCNVGWW